MNRDTIFKTFRPLDAFFVLFLCLCFLIRGAIASQRALEAGSDGSEEGGHVEERVSEALNKFGNFGVGRPGRLGSLHRGARVRKYELRRKLLSKALSPDIELYPSPLGVMPALAPFEGGPRHNHNASQAVFVANTAMFQQEIPFFRTLRRYYDGDIVMAVSPNAPKYYIDWATRTYNCIVYVVPTEKVGNNKDVALLGRPNSTMPAAQFRYYMYRIWAQQYNRDTIIMLSDFRDVLFQSNPFDYMLSTWRKSPFSMAVILENHPLKIIEKCNFNGVWLSKCYGPSQTKHVSWHTVSCSGVSYGTRNAIAIYSYLVSAHLDPLVRRRSAQNFLSSLGLAGEESVPRETRSRELSSNERCLSSGMDQGIHNWLLYSGELERSLGEAPHIFRQGDGPVNTLGSFVGAAARLRHDMFEIGVLKRVQKDKTAFNNTLLQGGSFNKRLSSILHSLDPVLVLNYNGDASPVVHQFDRIEFGAYSIPNIIMAAKLD